MGMVILCLNASTTLTVPFTKVHLHEIMCTCGIFRNTEFIESNSILRESGITTKILDRFKNLKMRGKPQVLGFQ